MHVDLSKESSDVTIVYKFFTDGYDIYCDRKIYS